MTESEARKIAFEHININEDTGKLYKDPCPIGKGIKKSNGSFMFEFECNNGSIGHIVVRSDGIALVLPK